MSFLLLLLLIDPRPDPVRLVDVIESPSARLNPPPLFAPGAPPVLGFRYFDARDRGRFGDLGLMTDDAGH